MPITATYTGVLRVSWLNDGRIHATSIHVKGLDGGYTVGPLDPSVPPREMLRRCADRFIARRRLRAARGVPLPCL